VGERRTVEVHTECWWGNLRERDRLEVLGVVGRIILKCILKKYIGTTWTGLIWLRIVGGEDHCLGGQVNTLEYYTAVIN
jgi:hypothetical protein